MGRGKLLSQPKKEELKPGCNWEGQAALAMPFLKLKKKDSEVKPGCNREGQATAAVGEGEKWTLLFSATTHFFNFPRFQFTLPVARAYFRDHPFFTERGIGAR